MLPFFPKKGPLLLFQCGRHRRSCASAGPFYLARFPRRCQSERAGGDRPKIGLERIDEAEGRRGWKPPRPAASRATLFFRFELRPPALPFRGRTIRFTAASCGGRPETPRGGPPDHPLSDLAPRRRKREGRAEPDRDDRAGRARTDGMDCAAGCRPRSRSSAPEALFDPVFEGIVFRPFDLQMPFRYPKKNKNNYWPEFRYEGPAGCAPYAAVQRFVNEAARRLAPRRGEVSPGCGSLIDERLQPASGV